MPRRRKRKIQKKVDSIAPQRRIAKTNQQDILNNRKGLVDIPYVLEQIINVDKHNPSGECKFSDMDIVEEQISGLKSVLIIRCQICGFNESINSTKPDCDLNLTAVQMALSSNWNCEKLNEYLSTYAISPINKEIFEAYEQILKENQGN